MVSSRRQRHEKASRFKRKTVGSFQFWRRPGSDDARATAKIWSGTHARYDFAGHRAAAKQTDGLTNRRGRCGGPDPSGNDHRQETGLQRIAFLWRSHRVCLGGAVATKRNISQKPDFVRRFTRGALKTFYWIKANEKEVVARLAKATKSSETDGLELYRTGVKLFSQDGTIPRSLQERMISMQRKVLQVEK